MRAVGPSRAQKSTPSRLFSRCVIDPTQVCFWPLTTKELHAVGAGLLELNRTGFSGGSISWEDGVHGKTEQILTRGSRASGPVGVRARRPARLAVGGGPVRRREDRVFIGNAPALGPASGTGSGRRPGLTTDERARLKAQEREIRELRRANEILRKASAYFAQAELDRRPK